MKKKNEVKMNENGFKIRANNCQSTDYTQWKINNNKTKLRKSEKWTIEVIENSHLTEITNIFVHNEKKGDIGIRKKKITRITYQQNTNRFRAWMQKLRISFHFIFLYVSLLFCAFVHLPNAYRYVHFKTTNVLCFLCFLLLLLVFLSFSFVLIFTKYLNIDGLHYWKIPIMFLHWKFTNFLFYVWHFYVLHRILPRCNI